MKLQSQEGNVPKTTRLGTGLRLELLTLRFPETLRHAAHTLWQRPCHPPRLLLSKFWTIPCVPNPVSGTPPPKTLTHTLRHGSLGSAGGPLPGTRTGHTAQRGWFPVCAGSSTRGISTSTLASFERPWVFASSCSHLGPKSSHAHYAAPVWGGSLLSAHRGTWLLLPLNREMSTLEPWTQLPGQPRRASGMKHGRTQLSGGRAGLPIIPSLVTLPRATDPASPEGPGLLGSPWASSDSDSRQEQASVKRFSVRLRHLPGRPSPSPPKTCRPRGWMRRTLW